VCKLDYSLTCYSTRQFVEACHWFCWRALQNAMHVPCKILHQAYSISVGENNNSNSTLGVERQMCGMAACNAVVPVPSGRAIDLPGECNLAFFCAQSSLDPRFEHILDDAAPLRWWRKEKSKEVETICSSAADTSTSSKDFGAPMDSRSP